MVQGFPVSRSYTKAEADARFGASSATFVDGETPSGSVNGSNAVFTLANAPSPATSLRVYQNGTVRTLTGDYTLSGSTLTFVTAPETGDIIRVDYRY